MKRMEKNIPFRLIGKKIVSFYLLMVNSMEKKNLLVLYTHEDPSSEKERIELYNVDSFEHRFIDGKSYLRVDCGGKYYYFKTQLTAISSFTNYVR